MTDRFLQFKCYKENKMVKFVLFQEGGAVKYHSRSYASYLQPCDVTGVYNEGVVKQVAQVCMPSLYPLTHQ